MVDAVDEKVPAPEEAEATDGVAAEPEGATDDLDESESAGDVAGTETDRNAEVEDAPDEGGEG